MKCWKVERVKLIVCIRIFAQIVEYTKNTQFICSLRNILKSEFRPRALETPFRHLLDTQKCPSWLELRVFSLQCTQICGFH